MVCLSHNNHAEKRDQEIAGMKMNMNASSTSVIIPVFTSIEDILPATHEDTHQQELKVNIL